MTEPVAIGMGLTQRMRDTLDAITAYVGRHGVMPSRRTLAADLNCAVSNANRLMTSLIERGELNTATPGGVLAGFGSEGIAVLGRCGYIAGDLDKDDMWRMVAEANAVRKLIADFSMLATSGAPA